RLLTSKRTQPGLAARHECNIMIQQSIKLTLLMGIFLSLQGSLRADNWPQWRGPNFDGSSREQNLPTIFSKRERVLWAAPLAGPSGATPVVWGDRVFVSSVDEEARTCLALAFDRLTGKELWRVSVAEGMGQDRMSTFSNPSPVTDGQR